MLYNKNGQSSVEEGIKESKKNHKSNDKQEISHPSRKNIKEVSIKKDRQKKIWESVEEIELCKKAIWETCFPDPLPAHEITKQ